MKLTIERLTALSPQDLIDLGKIWPHQQPEQWQSWLSNGKALFAARFNERLLGAVKIALQDDRAELQDLLVREVTRRRGVGLYLAQDAQRQLPQVAHWQLSTAGLAPRERGEVDNFMRACGSKGSKAEAWNAEFRATRTRRKPACPSSCKKMNARSVRAKNLGKIEGKKV